MSRASTSLIVGLIAVLAPASVAAAATTTHATVRTDPPRIWPTDSTPPSTLDEMCALAAETGWATEWEGVIRCTVAPMPEPRLSLVTVWHFLGVRAFVAVRTGSRYRVVATLDYEDDARGNAAATLVHVHRARVRDQDVLAFETAITMSDEDAADALGWRSRHLTACVYDDDDVATLRCTLRVTLEERVDHFSVVRSERTPSRWRREGTSRSEAIAIIRRDGRVRLRLRSGTWESLVESDSRRMSMPDSREVVLPFLDAEDLPLDRWSGG